ncbi:Unannotated [Lentimonas sp. CC19]|nr:Unannotated [Lentimonas sp. CC10]CAA6695970.1 Unannotated [Lentimonas sp. CC19]CAA7070233.1 Unannotated [Lentimonas sp. CC11]
MLDQTSMKRTAPRRLFIAGSFVGDVNTKKCEFWFNSEEAKTYFDSLHLLSAHSVEKVSPAGFHEVYFPRWLCDAKINSELFYSGFVAMLSLLFRDPLFLWELLVLEFKTKPFERPGRRLKFRRIRRAFLRGISGLGEVFRFFHHTSLCDGDTVVVWSEHLTGMRLLKREALRSGARLVFSEYGEIPGTTFICGQGMFHESWPIRYKEQFGELPVSSDEIAVMKAHLQSIVKGRISSKVGQYATDASMETLELPAGRPVIYVNGVQAHSSGLFPRCSDFSKEYSPDFGSNEDMLEYFAKLAEKHNWTILYKDHPNTSNYYFGQEVPACAFGEHVKVLGNIDIYEILSLADLTVSLGSKTVFLSLLDQVPVYLLGPYSICSDDLGSGVSAGGDPEEAILSALQSARSLDVDHDGLIVYLTRMMKYYYYSMDDDINSLFGRGRQQFWTDFIDYMSGGRSVISAKVKLEIST